MNAHEAERIACSMNQLRPDWPTAQLRTLLNDARMRDRPRRDVTVALAWVACETNSHSPYRVLEAGPWWRATAVDAPTDNRPERIPFTERCTACGNGEDHRLHTSGDHPFYRKAEVPDYDVSAIVADLRAQVHHGQPVVAPRKTLDDYARDPAVQRVRDQMTAAQAALELERAAQAKHPTPPVAPQETP